MTRFEAITRKPLVRAALAILGLALLFEVVRRVGVQRVLDEMKNSAGWLPALVALETGWLVCTTLAVRALYGARANSFGTRVWIRAGLWGYVTMLIAPAGRASGEAVRALVLTRAGAGPLAGLSAIRMQTISMYANAIASLAAALVALWLSGVGPLAAVIGANALVTAGIGTIFLVAQGSGRMAALAARVFPSVHEASWKGAFAERPSWGRSLLWETGGRVLQWFQYTFIVLAVSGQFGLKLGLVAQGIHLVAATVGDLIPAQLGISEVNFALASPVLGLSPPKAASIGVLAHIAQFLTMALCALLLLVVREDDAGEAVRSQTGVT